MNLREKFWKGLGSPVIDASVKKDSLLVYVNNVFGILAGRCGSVVVRKREQWDTKGPGSTLGLRSSFVLIETLSINRLKIF